MVKKAELEINGKMSETVKRLEDPVQRQRNLVEQERQKYLSEEEKIVKGRRKDWNTKCGFNRVNAELSRTVGHPGRDI